MTTTSRAAPDGKSNLMSRKFGKTLVASSTSLCQASSCVLLSTRRNDARSLASSFRSRNSSWNSSSRGALAARRAADTSTSNTRNEASRLANADTSVPPASSTSRGSVDSPLLNGRIPMDVSYSARFVPLVSATVTLLPLIVMRRPLPLVRLNWNVSRRDNRHGASLTRRRVIRSL
jgi:hypothetical protein